MRITALLENTTTRADVAIEHGLSLYIEAGGKTILFDMGQSELFAKNAERLGCDLRAVDFAILSHGHYDHGGGLPAFLAINDCAPVYLSRYAFGEQHNANGKYIGLDQLLAQNLRLRFTDGVTSVAPGFTLFDCNDRPRRGTLGTFGLTRREGDRLVPDDFRHEQSLVFETQRGLVVFNSCSHSGIVNIVRGVQKMLPGKKVYAVVGGFHMFGKGTPNGMNCSEEYVYKVADELKRLGVEEVYTGHCTGLPALALLKERFGAGCYGLTTGMAFEL
jgi:7,8-dihydropterin-6-yl-methyl-4-(beta-D-ribofuranosyl)aminobenzene 5'-phosphate synthase